MEKDVTIWHAPGFVQVSHEVPLVVPNDLKLGVPVWLHCSIHHDKQTGNWWITLLSKPNVDIGYWPKELFNLLDNGANIVGVGGVVQASRSGSSPPMGNGNFPTGSYTRSAMFKSVGFLDSKYEHHSMDSKEKLVDSPKCYGLGIERTIPFRFAPPGFFFNFGDPGGNSCGV
ncbi:Protein neprosin [Cardamine amara subsp. amara]|uniref:Protein neprosin n=1 Tax=Cardamine amara subsp. amara TaxID=228776 RepID=A0ABD1C460_CARAN